MIFVSLITFWHAVLSRFHYDKNLQSSLDFGVFITFGVVYFIFQAIFIVVMMYQVSYCNTKFAHVKHRDFSAVKFENFIQKKKKEFFNIFVPNID